MQQKTNTCINQTDFPPDSQGVKPASPDLDIFTYKRIRLLESVTGKNGARGTVGLPLQLGMYEQLPLWAGFFEAIGFKVVLPDPLPHTVYPERLNLVASERVCYPAKLMHCHIESLLNCGVSFIFMPCDEFNTDGGCSVNRYNCPVAAFYPELLRVWNDRLTDENFLSPYIDADKRKQTANKLYGFFRNFGVKKREITCGLEEGFSRLESYRSDVIAKADEILYKAEKQGRGTVILAGRPYHSDSEVNHGIVEHILSSGCAVISDDSIGEASSASVLNNWTYQSRLFRAAEFVAGRENVFLVHLVSAECKFDGVLSDQIRFITERQGKIYTRIILDETAARVL